MAFLPSLLILLLAGKSSEYGFGEKVKVLESAKEYKDFVRGVSLSKKPKKVAFVLFFDESLQESPPSPSPLETFKMASLNAGSDALSLLYAAVKCPMDEIDCKKKLGDELATVEISIYDGFNIESYRWSAPTNVNYYPAFMELARSRERGNLKARIRAKL